MRYRVRVFFARGITSWQSKVDEREVVFDCMAPWLWSARNLAHQWVGNRGALGWVIHDGDKVVEQFIP